MALITSKCALNGVVAAAGDRPQTSRRLAAAVNSRRRSAGGPGGGGAPRRPLLREDLLLLGASAKRQTSHTHRDGRQYRHKRWVAVNASAAGPKDVNQWRVRQVYGDGKVLLDQLREVADLLEDGFNSGRSSTDLLDGLVQKVRWSGGNFLCLVADDGRDGSEMVGACDLTLLPAGGPKKSKEGLVADVPSELGLEPDAHFLYLTRYRRRRIGQALLSKSLELAGKMTPQPVCVALHVDAANVPARGLYEAAGYDLVGEDDKEEDGEGGGEGGGKVKSEKKRGGWNFASLGKMVGGGGGGGGKKKGKKREVLMVRWLPPREKEIDDLGFDLGTRKWYQD